MKIYVARHGVTNLNKQKRINGRVDEPLAPEGFDQAKLATLSVPKSITHIYASELLRTRQTAAVIAEALNLPISHHKGIIEVDFGTLSGQSWQTVESGSELQKKYQLVQYDFQPFGGESATDVKNRVLAFLRKIHTEHKDGEVLLVSHGGIIRLLHFLQNGTVMKDIENASIHEFNLTKILDSSK